jgi:3-hydroxy-3-methylglutaryl CoA synthase
LYRVLQAAQGAALQRQLGNLYTASLFSGLAGLLAQQGEALTGKRLLCFSYGSGVVAAMFCLRGRDTQQQQEGQHLEQQQQQQQQQWSWQRQACGLQRMADMVSGVDCYDTCGQIRVQQHCRRPLPQPCALKTA